MSKATERGETAFSIDEPVYSWPVYFHPGHSVTVRRKLTHNWNHEATRQRIEAALNLSPAELDEQIASGEAAERAIVQQMLDLLDAWTERAPCTWALSIAKELSAYKGQGNTRNKWKRGPCGEEYISNAVYFLEIRMDESRPSRVPTTFYVTWALRLNLDVGGGYVVLAGATRKPFATDWEAQSYIKQRKDDLADLFAEMYPPLPTALAPYFYKFGFLPTKFRGHGTPRQFETDPDE